MNIKYIILALSLALPLQVCAQNEGQDEKGKEKTDAIPNVTADSAQLGIVRDSLAEAKRRLDAAYAERNDLRGQVDSLKGLIHALDPIIYKECILYPLSIRYNQQRINESLRAIKSYRNAIGDDHLSPDFKECIKIYLPFIEGPNPLYKQYSDELVRFLEKVENDLRSSKTEVMQTEMRKLYIQRILQLAYYKYYQQRNTPPYRSITFLDNALDSFKVLLNDSRSVVDDVQRLRTSITPKP